MSGMNVVSGPLVEAERNERIYAGGILVWPTLSPVAELTARLAEHLRRHFGAEPEHAHTRLDETDLADALQTSQRHVDADSDCQTQVRRIFEATGMGTDANCADSLRVRAQVPHTNVGRGVAPLAAHRDTWGTNIMAQTNWWAPIHPAPPERTIALFPPWFDRIVANDSAHWDFAEMRRRFKREGASADYPLLPTATETPAWHDALPVSLEPGGLLAFSGAHLHASVPNVTDRIRFSFEIRTVNAADALAGHGASNVDGQAPRTLWQLFRGLNDGNKLGDMA